jgi:hypothetical protein
MSQMVTIPEAAIALGCAKQNVYQTIERHNIKTTTKKEKRREVVVRTLEVRYVDLDILAKIIKTK